MDVPKPGQIAPDFSLPDADGNLVTLSQWRGEWVILYFYPRDNTPGCTAEAKDFTARAEEMRQLNATVLGISPDSAASHARFRDKHQLSVLLLSDADREVAETYGVWQLKKFMGKESMGIVRSTLIISPEGAIARVWSPVRGVKQHVAAVVEQLKTLQAGDRI